jgi:hypothetical protein
MDCADADAILYYLMWIPAGQTDKLVVLTLQITADSAARHAEYFSRAPGLVTLYR